MEDQSELLAGRPMRMEAFAGRDVYSLSEIVETCAQQSGFDVIEPGETPRGHGERAEKPLLDGIGGAVEGFEGCEQLVKVGLVFALEDQSFGGEPVLETVVADGGESFRGFGSSAVLRVAAICFDLSVSSHDEPSASC